MQKILREDHAESVVQRFLVDRNLAEFRFDHLGMQLLESRLCRNGHDIRPGSHHLAHTLVAEFHHLLDQIRLLRLDDALFLRGFHQRLYPFFRALLLGLFRFLFGNPRERLRAFEKHAHRPDQPHRASNERQERKQPAARGAVQQHVRDKMHGENHFENDKHAKLDQRFPSARNEVHHPARRFQHQKRQPEMAEDAEGAAAATPVDFQLWFDFRFEDVQMFVNAAGGHAPQLAVNQCQVGENGQREAHQHDTERVNPA